MVVSNEAILDNVGLAHNWDVTVHGDLYQLNTDFNARDLANLIQDRLILFCFSNAAIRLLLRRMAHLNAMQPNSLHDISNI